MPSTKNISRLLYLDANAYLRFYDNFAANYKLLLDSLLELQDDIFVTQQIVNEVSRNKLDVFVTTIKSQVDTFKFKNSLLPIHLNSAKDAEIAAWNKKNNSIAEEVKQQEKKLSELVSAIVEAIATQQDDVSTSLEKLFSSAAEPDDDMLTNAATRKQIGNPPGKKNDPLGDQISWEQLLQEIDYTDELYIISSDTDYFTKHNKQLYLNPFLHSDLTTRNDQMKIFCFDTLAEGLKSLNKSKKINALPKNKELDTIAEEEMASNDIRTIISGSNWLSSTGRMSPAFDIYGNPIKPSTLNFFDMYASDILSRGNFLNSAVNNELFKYVPSSSSLDGNIKSSNDQPTKPSHPDPKKGK